MTGLGHCLCRGACARCGETVAKMFYRDEPHPNAPKLSPDSHGFIWMPEDGFHQAVAHKASVDQRNIYGCRAATNCGSVYPGTGLCPAWKTKPSWFLIAEEDRMINPKTQRFMANRMGSSIRSKAVDHTPMLTAPDLVVDLILEAARETLAIGLLSGRTANVGE